MRKFTIGLLVLLIFIAGCNGSFEPELTRIDVQKTSEDGEKDGEERIIASKEQLQKIDQAFNKIKWAPKTKAEMARKEDVMAYFLHSGRKEFA